MIALLMALASEAIVPTRDETEAVVELRMVSAAKVREICADMGVVLAGTGGCAKAYVDRAPVRCVVVVPRVTDTGEIDRFAVIGHEVLHCFKGRYHSKPD